MLVMLAFSCSRSVWKHSLHIWNVADTEVETDLLEEVGEPLLTIEPSSPPEATSSTIGGSRMTCSSWTMSSLPPPAFTCSTSASIALRRCSSQQTSRFHHTILPTVAGSFFISRAVFKYIKLPPYFLAFHGQNNTFSRAVFRFLRLPP